MHAAHIAAASLLAIAAATAQGGAPSAPSPDRTFRIYDATGTGAGVLDLLAPYLARFGFAELPPRIVRPSGLSLVTFRRGNGDTARIIPGERCALLVFYATRVPVGRVDMGPGDRSSAFEFQLREFLGGLPTPRPLLVGAPRGDGLLRSQRSPCRDVF